MLVTAVITTFNRPQLVQRAILSVLAQTHGPLQVIVVEDGSDADLEGWITAEDLHRVQYVRHQQNRGLAAARNTGLGLADGDYVAFLDDDDEWKPQRIERQVALLEDLTLTQRDLTGVVYCGVEIRDQSGATLRIGHPRNKGNLREAIIREGASTWPSTSLFSKAALKKVGGFDAKLRSSVDHDIWMSLAAHGFHAEAVDESLVVTYRLSFGRMTTDTSSRIRGVRMYVEKWQPTYADWFGQSAGEVYAHRYFARVVGELAASKFVTGKLQEGWQAVRAVFEYSGETRYNIYVLMKYIVWLAAQRILPRRAIDLLLKIKGTVGGAAQKTPKLGGRR